MNPTGIPTVYRGRQYRSRLEARWAAFFDLLGWSYEYEPFDLAGWIPDFLLTGAKVLVEVKPVSSWPAEVMAEIDDCRGADGYEVFVAGCTVPVDIRQRVDSDEGLAIGWLRATPPGWNVAMPRTWCGAMVQRFQAMFPVLSGPPDQFEWREVSVGLFGSMDHFLRCDPGYRPRHDELGGFAFNRLHPTSEPVPWGVYVPACDDFYPDGSRREGVNLIVDLWTKAGNLTQWKGRQSIVS